MKRQMLAALVALGLSQAANAADWFVNGGLGVAKRDDVEQPPFTTLTLKYDTGQVLRLEGGVHAGSDFIFRGNVAHSRYGKLTAVGGSIVVGEDVVQDDVRLGAFGIFPVNEALSYRAGGGLAYLRDSSSSRSDNKKGAFVEAAAIWDVSRAWTLDLGVDGLFMTADNVPSGTNDRVDGLDYRLRTAYHATQVDVTLDVRRQWLDYKGGPDDGAWEFTVGVGRDWGRPGA